LDLKVVMATQYSLSGSATIMGKASPEASACPPVFGAQFVEVEVDSETGEARVLRIVAAHDVGRALNPLVTLKRL